MRAAVAFHAVGVDAKEAVPALIASLKDSHPWVRDWAAMGLGDYGPEAKEAAPALFTFIGDPYMGINNKNSEPFLGFGPDGRPDSVRVKSMRDHGRDAVKKIDPKEAEKRGIR